MATWQISHKMEVASKKNKKHYFFFAKISKVKILILTFFRKKKDYVYWAVITFLWRVPICPLYCSTLLFFSYLTCVNRNNTDVIMLKEEIPPRKKNIVDARGFFLCVSDSLSWHVYNHHSKKKSQDFSRDPFFYSCQHSSPREEQKK